MADFAPSVENHVKIRTATAGRKEIDNGDSKYLEIDSGTNGASILAIIATGDWSINKWVIGIYIPRIDGFMSPAPEDKKDEIDWSNKTEAGLISGPIAFPYNMFLKFSNNNTGIGSAIIGGVVVVYRSRQDLTLTWET